MPTVRFPFIGGAYEGRSRTANMQECVNLMFLPDSELGRPSLVGTPGLERYVQLGSDASIRGMLELRERLYIVSGNRLYYLDKDGNTGTIPGDHFLTDTGRVTMCKDENYIMISDGEYGYVFDRRNNTVIYLASDSYNFENSATSTFLDGYFCYHPLESNTFWRSDIHNPLSYDPLEFNAVYTPTGDIMRILEDHRELLIFKQDSVNIFDNTGTTDQVRGSELSFVFRQRRGAEMTVGLAAVHAIAQVDNTLCWLGNDRSVRRLNGYNPERISTPQLEYQFEQYTTVSDATAFGYSMGGLSFFQLNFPTENISWLYETKAGLWYKLKSFDDYGRGEGRHRADCYAYFNEMHLVGDYQYGTLYQLKDDVYEDDGHRIRRVRRCPVIDSMHREWTPPYVEFVFEPGVGLASTGGAGSDPQCSMRYSRNGGFSWSHYLSQDIGAKGQYDTRVRYYRLGQGRNWAFELTVNAAVPVVIVDALIGGQNE